MCTIQVQQNPSLLDMAFRTSTSGPPCQRSSGSFFRHWVSSSFLITPAPYASDSCRSRAELRQWFPLLSNLIQGADSIPLLLPSAEKQQKEVWSSRLQKWLYERFGVYIEDFRFQPEESTVETEEPLSAKRWESCFRIQCEVSAPRYWSVVVEGDAETDVLRVCCHLLLYIYCLYVRSGIIFNTLKVLFRYLLESYTDVCT